MDSVFWPFTIMSVDFEGGRGKTVRACLHLVTLCVLSDRISIWFVTFGHIKNGYKSNLELGLPHYHIKEINSVLHFIHHQPIKWSKIATGESGISSGKISYFTFSFIRGSLRVGLLAVSVVAMRVALALSYLTITCHIAYNTLSHVCFFNILGGVKCTYVVSKSRCIYTCPVSSGMRLRHKWFERSDLNPSRKRFEFGGLVFSPGTCREFLRGRGSNVK